MAEPPLRARDPYTPLKSEVPNKPIVGIGPDYGTGGYWLVAADGGVFAIGAPFLGSAAGMSLTLPVNGLVVTGDSIGYWLVAIDGGVFTFGDAVFEGSLAGQPLNPPVVGMAAHLTGGYWLARSDGRVFSFNPCPPMTGCGAG